jgi:hypothetical protein
VKRVLRHSVSHPIANTMCDERSFEMHVEPLDESENLYWQPLECH